MAASEAALSQLPDAAKFLQYHELVGITAAADPSCNAYTQMPTSQSGSGTMLMKERINAHRSSWASGYRLQPAEVGPLVVMHQATESIAALSDDCSPARTCDHHGSQVLPPRASSGRTSASGSPALCQNAAMTGD